MDSKNKNIIVYQLLPTDWRLVFRIVAVLVSWFYNQSLLWGIIHYFLGWVYIVYLILSGDFSNGGLGEVIKYYFYSK